MFLKKVFLAILLITTSLVVAFAISEIFLRNFLPQELITPIPAKKDKEIIYTLRPNTKAYLRGTSVRWYNLSTNSFGIRDKEYSTEKSDSFLRVVLVGDSISMGEGVEIEETFIKKFEEIANLNLKKQNIETINAAIRGYGNDQETIFYKRIAKKYKHDVAILGFFEGNDFDDNANGGIFELKNDRLIQTIPDKYNSPKFRYYSKQIFLQNLPFYQMFLENSHCANFLRARISRLLFRVTLEKNTVNRMINKISEKNILKTFRILEEWVILCKKKDIVPIIMYIPDMVNISNENIDDSRRIDLRYEKLLTDMNVIFINGRTAFMKEKNIAAIYLEDGHLSPFGHEVLGEKLWEIFSANSMLLGEIIST